MYKLHSTVLFYSIPILFAAIPSVELVKRVREMYNRNPSDVRFLIPVLHGLQKASFFNSLNVHM